MKSNPNGIHPIVAIALTLAVAALCALFFVRGHIFWGVVFALIAVDFGADAVLSFRHA